MSAPPLPADVTVTAAALGAVRTAEITNDGIEPRHVVLYFHGGVYVMGDAFLAADLASQVGRGTQAKVISADYRLAPEHSYPAAVDDALAAYEALLQNGTAPSDIVFAGESAGGGPLGLALVPLTVIIFALSARSGQLAARIGPRLQLSAGPFVVGAGLAMLAFSTSGAGYVTSVLPAVVVFGLGLAITVAPLTATAMSSAPAQHAGIASAVNNDLSRFGGLLAVARHTPAAGRHHRPALPAPGRARRRIQDRGTHLGRVVRRGRAPRRGHNHQPPLQPAGAPAPEECLHCGLDAPPLISSVSQTTGT